MTQIRTDRSVLICVHPCSIFVLRLRRSTNYVFPTRRMEMIMLKKLRPLAYVPVLVLAGLK
jgi:hypothetical protein